jgi:hypothetical protein
MIPLLLVLLVPPDTTKLLVEVVLSETQERVVVEALAVDSTLYLPSAQLAALIGTEIASGPWVGLDAIRAAFPTVVVAWLRHEMRVVLIDRMRSLPASRRAHQQVVARSQWAVQVPAWSGPFGSVAVDDSLRGVLDLGYVHRGRVSAAARMDDRGAAAWGLTVSPSALLFLSYTDGVYRSPHVSGRVAAGPLWLSTAYTPGSPLDVQGLVRVGAVQLFGSKQYGVVTITPSSRWSAQVAHQWTTGRTAARFTVGPTYASPFSFPITTLR